MAKARVPRTHQVMSVFRKETSKTGFKVVNALRIDRNRWKMFLRDPVTGRERTAVVDKSDLRSLRKFKSVVRHQV